MDMERMDEIARQETILKVNEKLAEIKADRRRGAEYTPAEEVGELMRAAVDANRRKAQNG